MKTKTLSGPETNKNKVNLAHLIKKHSREMQTLCAACSKAEPKIFTLPQTPFPFLDMGKK